MKVFRTIRQNSISENKLRNLLIYGIGEVVLIVIGILIALSIDNWNEDRKEAIEERKILIQLKNEFEKNLDQLNEKIYMRNKMTQASQGLLNYIDNPDIIIQDSLLYYLFRITQEPTFDPIQNDLTISGQLRMIKNDSLKIMLSYWTSDVYQVQELEQSWQKLRTDAVIPIFIENNFGRNTIAYLLNNGYTPDHALDKGLTLTYNIKPVELDLKTALVESSIPLQGAASTCILFNKLTNGQSFALRNKIETILRLIDESLESQDN